MTQHLSALLLEIDGVRYKDLEQHRFLTRDCFDLGARSPERVSIYPAAANGYYVMLKPLPRGWHTITFGGSGFLNGDFSIDVTYHLRVS